MSYKNFVAKSVKVRPEFEENLLVVHLPWKEQFDILVGEIPDFFMDIYANCNGTDPEEDAKHHHFIPEYRLLKIQELLKLHGEFVKEHSVEHGSIIPVLAKGSDEYICYRVTDSGEDMVAFVKGEVTPMYDSINSFWETLCQAYDEKVFGIDFKNTLSADESKFNELAKKNNPNSSYWG